jgi:oxygen-independent coproporphyrinogen-3 oxidase
MNNHEIPDSKIQCAGPRYTSYPTVPYWNETEFTYDNWIATFTKSFIESNSKEGIIYIHLPFCESMCTFVVATNITKNHEVEHPYIEAIIKEWSLYCKLLNENQL